MNKEKRENEKETMNVNQSFLFIFYGFFSILITIGIVEIIDVYCSWKPPVISFNSSVLIGLTGYKVVVLLLTFFPHPSFYFYFFVCSEVVRPNGKNLDSGALAACPDAA
jgi:hypothetical protein